ncbi:MULTISPECIES: Rossmann-like and DUF2520 domain-containing protein [Corynebacterium]|uniref:Rossmann-like and DUF2520 domain-containing protein n=1 Tax=Corynebacterium TaxID=1716 RepID=UPI001658CFB5|nr:MULTISPECIES: DUF2520 domain-containing protein [Corynebacterium]QNP92527.1 DUF2520 domain-containing protein [Corynebacterium zhongnanshanii]
MSIPDAQAPQLTVGIISAGAVGVAVAEACLRAGHHVHGVVARSEASRARAAERIPTVPVVSVEQAAQAAVVILAVPDPQLPTVIEQVAAVTQAGQIVAHTSGALGCEVLQPVTDTGALPLALHPAMTFTGEPADADRLAGCAWGVTSDSDQGAAVAELLIQSLEGVPVPVPEQGRAAYHAAMSHAANHTVALLTDAQRMLDHALLSPDGDEQSAVYPNPQSGFLLRRLVHAAVDNALDQRIDGLTGPAARDDAQAVLRHIQALRQLGGGMTMLPEAYVHAAERTAQLAGALEVERVLAEYYSWDS